MLIATMSTHVLRIARRVSDGVLDLLARVVDLQQQQPNLTSSGEQRHSKMKAEGRAEGVIRATVPAYTSRPGTGRTLQNSSLLGSPAPTWSFWVPTSPRPKTPLATSICRLEVELRNATLL